MYSGAPPGVYDFIVCWSCTWLLHVAGLTFDVAYTSVLKRAIRTCWAVLRELNLEWLPVHRNWRLNERHYGALQGLNKSETAAKHGEDQVKIWRRSYDIPPPPLDASDERHPSHDRRYAVHGVPAADLPATESLKETVARFIPAWNDEIAPAIRAGKRVLIAAHGNSIRALIKYLDEVSDKDIVELNIPTGETSRDVCTHAAIAQKHCFVAHNLRRDRLLTSLPSCASSPSFLPSLPSVVCLPCVVCLLLYCSHPAGV